MHPTESVNTLHTSFEKIQAIESLAHLNNSYEYEIKNIQKEQYAFSRTQERTKQQQAISNYFQKISIENDDISSKSISNSTSTLKKLSLNIEKNNAENRKQPINWKEDNIQKESNDIYPKSSFQDANLNQQEKIPKPKDNNLTFQQFKGALSENKSQFYKKKQKYLFKQDLDVRETKETIYNLNLESEAVHKGEEGDQHEDNQSKCNLNNNKQGRFNSYQESSQINKETSILNNQMGNKSAPFLSIEGQDEGQQPKKILKFKESREVMIKRENKLQRQLSSTSFGYQNIYKVKIQDEENKLRIEELPKEEIQLPNLSTSIQEQGIIKKKKNVKRGSFMIFNNDNTEETLERRSNMKKLTYLSNTTSRLGEDNTLDHHNTQNEKTINNSSIFIRNNENSNTTIQKVQYEGKVGNWNLAVQLKNINRFISKIRDQTQEGNFTRLLPHHLNLINDASFQPEGGSAEYFDTDQNKLSFSQQLLKLIPIFDPDNIFLLSFKVFLLFVMVIEVFILPVEIGFSINLLSINRNTRVLLRDFPLLFFILDMLLRINTSFYENGLIVRNRSKIFQKFTLILILNFINTLSLLLQNQIANSATLFLIFLLRIYLLNSKSTDVLDNFSILERYPAICNIIKLVFIQLIVGHVSGCGFHFITTLDIKDNIETSWIKYYGLDYMSIAERYLTSIYYATITMITVGYGDFTPRNQLERIYVISIVIISGTVFAYTVNMIGAIFQEKEKKVANYKQIKFDISNYMINRSISKKTQLKVYNYLEYIDKKDNESPEKGQRILSSISEHLKNEVYREFYGQILTSSKLFHNKFSFQFIQKVSLRMQEKMYGPGEVIVVEGSQLNPSLYYILKGKVEMYSMRKENRYNLGYLTQEDSFGHRCFNACLPQEWSAVTTEVTHLVYITQENFLECVKEFPLDLVMKHYFSITKNEIIPQEIFMQMKEEIIFGQNRYMNPCYSCSKMTHVSTDCPLIHYHRNKQLCVNKYLHYIPEKQRREINRNRKKNNALQDQQNYKEQLKFYRINLSFSLATKYFLAPSEINIKEDESDKQFFERMCKFKFDEKSNIIQDSTQTDGDYDDEQEDDEEEGEEIDQENSQNYQNSQQSKTHRNSELEQQLKQKTHSPYTGNRMRVNSVGLIGQRRMNQQMNNKMLSKNKKENIDSQDSSPNDSFFECNFQKKVELNPKKVLINKFQMQPIKLHNHHHHHHQKRILELLDDSFSPRYQIELNQNNEEMIQINDDLFIDQYDFTKEIQNNNNNNNNRPRRNTTLKGQKIINKIGMSNMLRSRIVDADKKCSRENSKLTISKQKRDTGISQVFNNNSLNIQKKQPILPRTSFLIQQSNPILSNIMQLNQQLLQVLPNNHTYLPQNHPSAHLQPIHFLNNSPLKKKEEFFMSEFEAMKEYSIYFPSQNFNAIIKKINLKINILKRKRLLEMPQTFVRRAKKRMTTQSKMQQSSSYKVLPVPDIPLDN